MALSTRRWLEIAVLGCLALAVIYWPGSAAQDEDPARVTQLARPHHAVQFRTSLEGDIGRGLILLQLRDRILASLANQRGEAAPVEFQFPGSRRIQADRLRAATESVTRLLRPATPLIRTIVVARPDTAYGLPTGGRIPLWGTWYVLPSATNGRVCLALPRQDELARQVGFLFDPAATPQSGTESSLLVPLGPCAFYTAFGAPSAGIEQWLRAQHYATASTAHWMEPPARVRRPTIDDLSHVSVMSLWEVLRQGSSGAFEMGNLSLQARACAHGRAAQCRAALRPPFREARQSLGDYGIARQYWWAREDLGASFLSDLVRLESRDAFARFWQSSLPVDSAFQQAFGEPLETWMSRWLLSNIERPRFGPVIRIGSLLFGLGLVVVAVIAAGVVSQRRQVG